MSVDWNKPIQTRDGRKAEFKRICDEATIYRAVEMEGNGEIRVYTQDGLVPHLYGESQDDIINVPEPPAWMVKAAEQLSSLSIPKDRIIEILMKHAKEAV